MRYERRQPIYALRILIKRVTITKDKIGVELHELPVGALQLALDSRHSRMSLSGIQAVNISLKKVEGLDSRLRGNDGVGDNDLAGVSATLPLMSRTAVRKLGVKWRARWDENQTAQISPIVPPFALRATGGKPTHLIPAFESTWPFSLGRIINGEKVLEELVTAPRSLGEGGP